MSSPRALSELLEGAVVRALARVTGDARCHLVGGVVRDRLRGRPSEDYDVTVGEGAEAIARRLARALPARRIRLGGDRFAAFRLVGDGFQVDLWDREGGSLLADLERRDFTINSIAVALDGEVVDPLGGFGDVERRRLRANRATSFAEDPLRVVRLVRFAADGYRVTARTAAWARRAAAAVDGVAPERVREELRLALQAPLGAEAVHWLAATGLYPRLWGETGVGPASSRSGELGLAARKLERRLTRHDASPAEALLARHALLAAFPLAASRRPSERLEALASRRLLSRRDHREIATLLPRGDRPRTEGEKRRFLHHAGTGWPFAVAVRAALATRTERVVWDRLATGLQRLAAADPAIFDPEPFLDGREIQRLTGLGSGPELGRVVAALRQAQVEGSVRTRREATAYVHGLTPRRSSGAD